MEWLEFLNMNRILHSSIHHTSSLSFIVRSFARSVFGSLVLLLLIFDWHFSRLLIPPLLLLYRIYLNLPNKQPSCQITPYIFVACMFYFGHLTATLRNDFCPMQAGRRRHPFGIHTHQVAWMLHNQLPKESRPIPDRRPLELGRNGIFLSTV